METREEVREFVQELDQKTFDKLYYYMVQRCYYRPPQLIKLCKEMEKNGD